MGESIYRMFTGFRGYDVWQGKIVASWRANEGGFRQAATPDLLYH